MTTRQIAPAAEYVRHLVDCPAISGNGDADCRCGAVEFLAIIESTQQQLSAAVKSLAQASGEPLSINAVDPVLRGVAEVRRAHEDSSSADLSPSLAARVHALIAQWREFAEVERNDRWCNTDDAMIWRSIHQHRGKVFDKCADALEAALAAARVPESEK